MKKIILLIHLFILTFSIAQDLNLKEIQENVTNNNSKLFYESLMAEFKNNPQVFLSDSVKYTHLYYGKLFSKYYTKTLERKSEYLKFTKLISQKKYQEALKIGEEIIDKDPVNLSVLLNMVSCYNEVDKENSGLGKLQTQINVLMKAIAGYGDGKSEVTAFKVISTGDEFTLVSYLGINIKKYDIISKDIKSGAMLDTWIKDKNYKADNRNKVFVQLLSN